MAGHYIRRAPPIGGARASSAFRAVRGIKRTAPNADAGSNFPDEAHTMDQADTSQSRSTAFPLTQRELVGLALQRGARRPDPAAATAPHAQRDRVRQALALGFGGPKGATRAARRGIVR
jgi:hypothetical protein